jgi:heptosyltransferase-1
MSLIAFDKSKINKILVISLTNIGDVILTFPVIDLLKKNFPSAKLSVVIGPKAKPLLQGNPYLDKVYIFNKHQAPLKSLAWIFELRKEKFDLVIDLRNTAVPLLISPRYRTSYRAGKTNNVHMRVKHLDRLNAVYPFGTQTNVRYSLFISDDHKTYVDKIIEEEIGPGQRYVVVAPGAADQAKRWTEAGFADVCDQLVKTGMKIVFVGDEGDRKTARQIEGLMTAPRVLNLCGQAGLPHLAELFKHCSFALLNDSAPMHLASYLDVPVLALFGPTDPLKYGPWSFRSAFLRKNGSCPLCARLKNALRHTCMESITSRDVLSALEANMPPASGHLQHEG